MSKHFDDSYTLINADDEILASRNPNHNNYDSGFYREHKMIHTSLDTETLGTVSNSVIISIGAFVGADLRRSNLNESEFIKCNVFNAKLFDNVYAISVVSRLFDPETGISGFHVFNTTAGVVVFIHSKFYTVDALTTHFYTLFGRSRAAEYLLAVKTFAINTHGESRWK